MMGDKREAEEENSSRRLTAFSTAATTIAATALVAAATVAAAALSATSGGGVTPRVSQHPASKPSPPIDIPRVLPSQHDRRAASSQSLLEPAIDANLADILDGDSPELSVETPFYWHVPKAAGTTMQTLFSVCLGLTVANGVGRGHDADESLRIIKVPGMVGPGRYVNVDVASPPGITHAASMHLAQSGLADVVVSPLFAEAAVELFAEPPHRARMFALFRHPVARAVSSFFYLRRATWEPSYHVEWEDMTLLEYATHHAEHDWMVHVLAGRTRGPATEDDLAVAKEILRRKCLVGLVGRMEESVRRFESYFGWKDRLGASEDDENARRRSEGCVENMMHGARGGVGRSNHHDHPPAQEGSDEWEVLMKANRMDVQLYEYAEGLFEEQMQLFEKDEEDST